MPLQWGKGNEGLLDHKPFGTPVRPASAVACLVLIYSGHCLVQAHGLVRGPRRRPPSLAPQSWGLLRNLNPPFIPS